MEYQLPKKSKTMYQRNQKVTLAERQADIEIMDFPFKIWIKGCVV